MFLHHILEDIDYSIQKSKHGFNLYYGEGALPKPYWDFIRLTRDTLFKAQCFHVGNIGDFITKARMSRHVGDLFSDKTLRLPYQVTWFDWFDANMKINGRFVTLKRGVLAEVIEKEPYTIAFSQLDTYTSDTKWSASPITLILSVTGDMGSSEALKQLYKTVPHLERPDDNFNKENTLFLFYLGPEFMDVLKSLQEQMIISIYVVEQTLLFLSCKNVMATPIKPPVKLQAKRIKRGKMPLFTYKVLTIKPGAQKKAAGSFPPNFDPKRIHLCMGHYKEYTADAPLFGRIVGRYFWNPHVRGTNTDGVVIKDYEVKGGV